MQTTIERPVCDRRVAPEAPAVRVRSIRRTDATELQHFYAELSPESRRTRFLYGCLGLSQAQSLSFCAADHNHREGFLAVEGAGGMERIVGHLCIEPNDMDEAEVAIAVADGSQGRGIGRRLLGSGVAWARMEGISRITATMCVGNTPMYHLLVGLHRPMRQRWMSDGVSEVAIDLSGRVDVFGSPDRPRESKENAMKAIVVYESHWGNTAAVARAIAEGFGPEARALTTDEAPPDTVAAADVIVAGAPIMALGLPSDRTLASLSGDTKAPTPPDLRHASMRSWLDRLPAGHGRSAEFETGFRWSPGGATGAIGHRLEQAGFKRVTKSRRFVVTGSYGPLRPGEIESARRWGAELAELVGASDPDAGRSPVASVRG